MLKAKKTITGKKCVGEVLDYRNTFTIKEGTIIRNYFIRNEHTIMTEIDGVEYDIGHVSYYEEVK